MAAVARCLADTSALARLHHPDVAAVLVIFDHLHPSGHHVSAPAAAGCGEDGPGNRRACRACAYACR